jgi:hypothetical protein
MHVCASSITAALLPACFCVFRYGDRPGPPSREGSRGYGGSRGSGGAGAPPPPPPRGGGGGRGYRCVLCLQDSKMQHITHAADVVLCVSLENAVHVLCCGHTVLRTSDLCYNSSKQRALRIVLSQHSAEHLRQLLQHCPISPACSTTLVYLLQGL